jgi:hypothetical protein
MAGRTHNVGQATRINRGKGAREYRRTLWLADLLAQGADSNARPGHVYAAKAILSMELVQIIDWVSLADPDVRMGIMVL